MAWQQAQDDEPKRRQWRKSKHWSGVCKNLGKYILTGGAAAPFFGIGGAVLSWALLAGALAFGGAIPYAGYKFSPDESSEPKQDR